MRHTSITNTQLASMQFEAGVLCRSFDLENPTIDAQDVICATTGGFSLSITPDIVDLGEDVYMMAEGHREMRRVTGWTVEASVTMVGISRQMIRIALGAADIDGLAVIPRDHLEQTDYEELWWIGERMDGGFVAVRLINVLNVDGLDIQTSDGGHGSISLRLVAHGSLDETDEIPVEIYEISNTPFFYILDYIYLMTEGTGRDEFLVDEETGVLYIEERGDWHYTVDIETGTMEVTEA